MKARHSVLGYMTIHLPRMRTRSSAYRTSIFGVLSPRRAVPAHWRFGIGVQCAAGIQGAAAFHAFCDGLNDDLVIHRNLLLRNMGDDTETVLKRLAATPSIASFTLWIKHRMVEDIQTSRQRWQGILDVLSSMPDRCSQSDLVYHGKSLYRGIALMQAMLIGMPDFDHIVVLCTTERPEEVEPRPKCFPYDSSIASQRVANINNITIGFFPPATYAGTGCTRDFIETWTASCDHVVEPAAWLCALWCQHGQKNFGMFLKDNGQITKRSTALLNAKRRIGQKVRAAVLNIIETGALRGNKGYRKLAATERMAQ